MEFQFGWRPCRKGTFGGAWRKILEPLLGDRICRLTEKMQ